jgi:hypothetical protein
MLSHQLCFGTCFYFLSTAVGEIMAVDGRFLDLSTNVMMHVEAIIVTTLITTARVYKRQTQQVLPAECYLLCGKCIILRSRCLHLARLANQYIYPEQTNLSSSQRMAAGMQHYADRTATSALPTRIVKSASRSISILQVQKRKMVQ